MIKVTFEVTPKEYEVIKKSLHNYKGRLIYVKNNANNHRESIDGIDEMRTLERLIEEMEGGSQTNTYYKKRY